MSPKHMLVILFALLTTPVLAQETEEGTVQRSEYQGRYESKQTSEATIQSSSESMSTSEATRDDIVSLKCDTRGMTENHILLRKISLADFEITQSETVESNTDQERLNELMTFRNNGIQRLINELTDEEFFEFNVEEQLFIVEEFKHLSPERGAHFYSLYKENY